MNRKSDWIIPAGLVLLTLLPSLAGAGRLADLAGSGPVTAENARFFTAPYTVAFHIAGACLFGLLGALQFSPGFRVRYPRWHRRAGTVALAAGVITALTGLRLTLIFPHLATDGPTLFSMRMVVGIAMLLSIFLAVRAVSLRQFSVHGAWMMRAYALGMGAATHLPWLVITGSLPTGYSRDAAMAAAWLINLAFVEWWLRRDETGITNSLSSSLPR